MLQFFNIIYYIQSYLTLFISIESTHLPSLERFTSILVNIPFAIGSYRKLVIALACNGCATFKGSGILMVFRGQVLEGLWLNFSALFN